MKWTKSLVLAASLFTAAYQVQAQDNLINALKANQNDNSKTGFTFTEIINLANTPIKNQGSSGTCWSYSGNSFLESEMIRMGKQPIEIAQIFTARNTYMEKAKNYVRLHGGLSLGEGGQFHDVLNVFRKYGSVPREVYTGLNYGTTRNNFSDLTSMLDAMLEAIVKGKTVNPNWEKAYAATMDSYFGAYPEKFDYKGKTYTPRTFADQVIGINPDDYVGIASVTDHPYYNQFVLLIPDNWSFDRFYNVQINDLTDIIDNALQKGFTVAWATDVSEKSFSWKNGVAYVPEKPVEEMTEQERASMFIGPKPEAKITAEARQKAFDNWETPDDHGMHIVGLAKDQNGKEYYIVKNSWGDSNDYHGYLYVTKEFLRYKTTSLLVHKNGIQNALKAKMNIK